MSNVSLHIGDCRKVWVLWPPTPIDNNIFYSARKEATGTEEDKMWEVVGDTLEGRQIVITDWDMGLYIP